jgi:hypothetical protein
METKAKPPDAILAVNLSAEINAAFDVARSLAAAATGTARRAVVQALECGRLLNLQRAALPHGAWQPWLSANCPAISFPTARRYMRLAKRWPGPAADTMGLRQAYLVTGVLPDAARARCAPGPATPTVNFTRGLDQFRRWFNHRVGELPLDRWSPAARRLLRNELAWFSNLHQRLLQAEHPEPPAFPPHRPPSKASR